MGPWLCGYHEWVYGYQPIIGWSKGLYKYVDTKMYVCTTQQWHPMCVHVEPGSSTATKWNWSVMLKTTDAGVDGEVIRGELRHAG